MIRTAIIGLGRMGMRHAQVVAQSGLNLAAVCDGIPATREAAAAKLGVAEENLYADAHRLIDEVKPELLIVSTTAPSHRDIVVHAAAAGVGMILCEKPMATSIAACDAMIDACARSGTKLAINHQMRFMEQYTRPKALIDSDLMGGLGSIVVSAGNFGMAMNGTHYFEMFRFMTGEAPESVAAWFSSDVVPNPRGPQFSDAAGAILLRTASGKRFFLDCSTDQGHGVLVTYNCRHGRIMIDELAGDMTVVARKSEHRNAPTTAYGMAWETERIAITPADAVQPTRAVVEALVSGKDFPTGEDGRLAMRVLIAAHMSAERGGVSVRLDELAISSGRELPVA